VDSPKKLKEGAEKRVVDTNEPGTDRDIDYAISSGNAKLENTMLKLFYLAEEVLKASNERERAIYFDAISGEMLDEEQITEARKVRMQTFNRHWVYEMRPIQVYWGSTGQSPVGAKWVGTNKRHKESPI
jgi:hypothetical protein